ncbi:MAG: LytR/AlgR family response regulator transcription factor [Vicinamibacterales bacterium]
MRALIVDDERLARAELRRLLAAHPKIEIVGEARNGDEAVAMTAALHPDLLFLDVQMPGLTGLEALERMDEVPPVIFTTAYDRYAIKAFEVNALDYLVKPIVPARLATALARAAATPPGRPTALTRVFVRDGERCWIVSLVDVFLLESEGNYTRLHFGTDRPLIRRSLAGIEARLDPGVFFRANRNAIVNLGWIQRLDDGVGGGLVARLRGGSSVDVSRRQAARLRERMSL